MKAIALLVFIISICSKDLYAINLEKIFSTRDDPTLQQNTEVRVDTQTQNKIPVDVTGYFHFFWSNTLQEDQYNINNANGQAENEGFVNFFYHNEINDKQHYSINFQAKKRFNNSTRLREVFEFEDLSLGKIQLSNYKKIQDDLLVNTYWIKKGSNGAFDRNINTSLTIQNDFENPRNPNVMNNTMTGYDTAMIYGSNTDSATLALYKNFLDKNLTLGVSYTPKVYYDTINNPFANYKNVITFGALYQTQINEQLKLKLSALGEHGVPAEQLTIPHNGLTLANLNALNLGALIEYNKLSIASSIGMWGKSNHLENVATGPNPNDITPSKNSYYFDIATSYNINEKTGLSLSYFKSLYGQNYSQDGIFNSIDKPAINGQAGQSEFHNISLALDYKLFSDFVVPYAEVNKFIVKDNNALVEDQKRKDNIGWVFILGAKSKF
jgi:hypothetical protein